MTETAVKHPTMTATFSGASDDLVHVDGWDDKYDEVGCYGDKGTFTLRFGPLGALIRPQYNGTWSFAIDMIDEDHPMLPIASMVDVCETCPYSTALKIVVPEGTTIEYNRNTL